MLAGGLVDGPDPRRSLTLWSATDVEAYGLLSVNISSKRFPDGAVELSGAGMIAGAPISISSKFISVVGSGFAGSIAFGFSSSSESLSDYFLPIPPNRSFFIFSFFSSIGFGTSFFL